MIIFFTIIILISSEYNLNTVDMAAYIVDFWYKWSKSNFDYKNAMQSENINDTNILNF